MKIDIEETKRVAELYGVEIVPVDERNTNEITLFKDGHGKTVAYFSGSHIEPVNSETMFRSEEIDFDFDIRNIPKEQWGNRDNYLFLEEYFGIKFKWYQKLYFRIISKLNKLGVIK